MPTFYGLPSDGTVIPEQLETALAADIAAPESAIGGAIVEVVDALHVSFPGAATGAENRTALQAGIEQAATEGRALFIKGTTFGQPAPIAGTAAVTSTVRIYGAGATRTVLRQVSKPEPLFRVTGPNATIEHVGVLGDGLDMTGTAGPIDYARYAGVWLDTGSDGARVRHIKGTGLHRAVRIDPDETTTATPAEVPNLRDLVVEHIESDRCWCGVSAVGFDDLKLSNIRGTYAKAYGTNVDTGQPPHLIYVIDRGSTVGRTNTVLRTTDCLAWDSGVPAGESGGEPAAPYAIKGVTSWTYDGMDARNCAGLFDLIGLSDVDAGSATSYDDVYPLGGGRASVAIKESTGAKIHAVVRSKVGDYGRQVYIESTCSDVTVDGQFTVNPTTAVTGVNTGIARVSGKRNTLVGTIINRGAHMRSAVSVSSSSAAGNHVRVETVGSFRFPVEVLQGVKNVVTYDSTRLRADPGAGADAAPVYVGSEAVRTILRNLAGGDPDVPGYYDTFDRPDGTSLVETTDGQPYTILNNGRFETQGGQLVTTYAQTGGAFALPAGGASDGVITFKIGTVGTGVDAYLFRTDYVPANGAAFAQDFLRLGYITGTGAPEPRLQKRINGGTVTNVASAPAGTAFAAGDTVTITMVGADITIALNGTTIITATDTDHTTRVASGPYTNTPASSGWKLDEIRFDPAA